MLNKAFQSTTLPAINMEPDSGSLEKESGLPGPFVRVNVSWWEGLSGAKDRTPTQFTISVMFLWFPFEPH